MVAKIVRREELHYIRAERIRPFDLRRRHCSRNGYHPETFRLGNHLRIGIRTHYEGGARIVRGADLIDGEHGPRADRHP